MDVWWTFVELFCFFIGMTGCILLKLDHVVPGPYMDEIFHIPQAQKYCQGDFATVTWFQYERYLG